MRYQIRVPSTITNNMFECPQCFGTFIGDPYKPPEYLKHAKQMRGCLCDQCGQKIEAILRQSSL
jgi:transcription elongation factor Elf1